VQPAAQTNMPPNFVDDQRRLWTKEMASTCHLPRVLLGKGVWPWACQRPKGVPLGESCLALDCQRPRVSLWERVVGPTLVNGQRVSLWEKRCLAWTCQRPKGVPLGERCLALDLSAAKGLPLEKVVWPWTCQRPKVSRWEKVVWPWTCQWPKGPSRRTLSGPRLFAAMGSRWGKKRGCQPGTHDRLSWRRPLLWYCRRA